MRLDVPSSKFCFGFAPNTWGKLSMDQCGDLCPKGTSPVVESAIAVEGEGRASFRRLDLPALVANFPGLFSSGIGTAKCEPYDIELTDATPVRSPPY
jgi:hypothetical protein